MTEQEQQAAIDHFSKRANDYEKKFNELVDKYAELSIRYSDLAEKYSNYIYEISVIERLKDVEITCKTEGNE